MSRYCRSQSVSPLPRTRGLQRPEEHKLGLASCFLPHRAHCRCSTLPSRPISHQLVVVVEVLDMSRYCRSQSVSPLPGTRVPQTLEGCMHEILSCFLPHRARCNCSTLPSHPTAHQQELGFRWARWPWWPRPSRRPATPPSPPPGSSPPPPPPLPQPPRTTCSRSK